MTSPSLTLPGSLYRPKKLPRVIRRQFAVIRLTVFIALIGLSLLAIAWRNVLHERLGIDIARQRTEIEVLGQEIAHLQGKTKSAASYPMIAKWAAQQHGWKPISGRVDQVSIPQASQSARVLTEAGLAGASAHE